MTDQFDTLETNAAAAVKKSHSFLTILTFESEVYPGNWTLSITRKCGNTESKTITGGLSVEHVAALIAQELASE